MAEAAYVVCLCYLLGREIGSGVAKIVVHVETDGTMQTSASRVLFITLAEKVWKDVSSSCLLDVAQWLPGEDECADVATLAIKAVAAAVAPVDGL